MGTSSASRKLDRLAAVRSGEATHPQVVLGLGAPIRHGHLDQERGVGKDGRLPEVGMEGLAALGPRSTEAGVEMHLVHGLIAPQIEREVPSDNQAAAHLPVEKGRRRRCSPDQAAGSWPAEARCRRVPEQVNAERAVVAQLADPVVQSGWDGLDRTAPYTC